MVPDLRRVRKVPVGLILFNRPGCTRRVFERIAEYEPEKLLLVADGPRFPEEEDRCQQARAVATEVNWKCDVLTNFSRTNLGMKDREISGFTWIFEVCDEAIILEDDTLPSRSFFPFCAELLERYRDDGRVKMIGGDNYCLGSPRLQDSYFFSKYPGTWGWAGWRRAWQEYDKDMTLWPSVRDTAWLEKAIGDVTSAQEWRARFDATYEGAISTWDYQWVFSMWRQEGFCINPGRNLVRNIGFGSGATNTFGRRRMSRFRAAELEFPLRHPSSIEWNRAADRQMFDGERRLMREGVARALLRRGLRRGWRSRVAARRRRRE